MNSGKKSFNTNIKGRKSVRSFDAESRASTPQKYGRHNQPIQRAVNNNRPFDPKEFVVAQCSQREIQVFKEIFDFFDLDDDGMLTPMDLRKAMIYYGKYHPKRNFIYQMMAIYDNDQSGQINFKQFVQMMTRRINEQDKQQDIKRVFSQIDQDQKGFIDKQDLKALAQQLKQTFIQQDYEQIMKSCDPKNQGKFISWQAFYAFNKKKQF